MSDDAGLRIDPRLQAVLDGGHRSDEHRKRDQYRHPAQTFSFFGLRASDTLVDIWPGSTGWTTEILAPYLKDTGRYIAAGYDPATETSFDATKSQALFEEKLAGNAELYEKVIKGRMSSNLFDFGTPESADMILCLRVHHIFMLNDYLEEITAAFFKTLKPGGVLGVVEHREDTARPIDPKGTRGYVHEDYVIERAEHAGFALEAKSELNANPKDTKDYPNAVWSLPPWMVGVPERERRQQMVIGESDRMTLRFRKPQR